MIDLTAMDEISDDARARANMARLAAAQALTGANSAVIFATGSIVGATLAPDISLATVPLSMYVVGLPPARCRPVRSRAPMVAVSPSSSARAAASQPACSARLLYCMRPTFPNQVFDRGSS
jgi:hypothetical protein